jgi:hypothetical protein
VSKKPQWPGLFEQVFWQRVAWLLGSGPQRFAVGGWKSRDPAAAGQGSKLSLSGCPNFPARL